MGESVKQRGPKPTREATRARAMIEAAIVDAHDESEQMTGWLTMLEEHLELPFETEVLGVHVRVEQIKLRDERSLVAQCRRANSRQLIDVLDLPMPTPRPAGAEWIEAYRQWRSGW